MKIREFRPINRFIWETIQQSAKLSRTRPDTQSYVAYRMM